MTEAESEAAQQIRELKAWKTKGADNLHTPQTLLKALLLDAADVRNGFYIVALSKQIVILLCYHHQEIKIIKQNVN